MGWIKNIVKGKTTASWKFSQAEFVEDARILDNPGRGWYLLHSFAADEPINEEELKWCICKEHKLALVLIDIGKYRNIPLDIEALTNIGAILRFFNCAGQEVILRIVYDRIGKGIEREPTLMNMILRHMNQIGPVIEVHADCIYTLQGLFIGSWGEMHNTKFLKAESLEKLAVTLWKATRGSCYMAVRRPVQWRYVIPEEMAADSKGQAGRLGLFDDGMLGSDSHLGTFGVQPRKEAGWQEAWMRDEELEFDNRQSRLAPIGGEALMGAREQALPFSEVIKTFRRMGVSYLHSVHDPRLISHWKENQYVNEKGQEMSQFDYIGNHLGYRFVVRKADILAAKRMTLSIEIANVGFSGIYEETEVYLILEDSGKGKRKIILNEDARTWYGSQTVTISRVLDIIDMKSCSVYLGMRRCKDGCDILFANEGADDVVYLGHMKTK